MTAMKPFGSGRTKGLELLLRDRREVPDVLSAIPVGCGRS